VVLKSEQVTNFSKRRLLGGLQMADDGPATISMSKVRCRKRLGAGLGQHAAALNNSAQG